MIRFSSLVACTLLAGGVVGAQSRYVVDALARPGSNFSTLSAAFAVAVHGDTVEVRGDSAGGPPLAYGFASTNQGISVFGINAPPQLRSLSLNLEVRDVPAGETFRFVGFEAARNSELGIQIIDCSGAVHLEDVHNDEFGPMAGPAKPGVLIQNSDFVSLHNLSVFGSPAVSVGGSRVLLTDCMLGVTRIGLGLGWPINASASRVEISQPVFRAVAVTEPAISAFGCDLIIGGDASALMQGGGFPLAQSAIREFGGTVTIDPTIQLNPMGTLPGVPVIQSSAPVQSRIVPTVITRQQPGGIDFRLTAAPGDFVFCLLGLPASPYPTIFGDALLQPAPLQTLLALQVTSQSFQLSVPVPAGVAMFGAFGTQAVVLGTQGVTTSLGCHFVIH